MKWLYRAMMALGLIIIAANAFITIEGVNDTPVKEVDARLTGYIYIFSAYIFSLRDKVEKKHKNDGENRP